MSLSTQHYTEPIAWFLRCQILQCLFTVNRFLPAILWIFNWKMVINGFNLTVANQQKSRGGTYCSLQITYSQAITAHVEAFIVYWLFPFGCNLDFLSLTINLFFKKSLLTAEFLWYNCQTTCEKPGRTGKGLKRRSFFLLNWNSQTWVNRENHLRSRPRQYLF